MPAVVTRPKVPDARRMDNNSGGTEVGDGEHSSQVSAMLSSPSAGGMRVAGNYAQRGSPGNVLHKK